MARRVKYCWIVETQTSRGWKPCYQSEVNYSKEWADKNRQELQKRYGGSKYRVVKYISAEAK